MARQWEDMARRRQSYLCGTVSALRRADALCFADCAGGFAVGAGSVAGRMRLCCRRSCPAEPASAAAAAAAFWAATLNAPAAGTRVVAGSGLPAAAAALCTALANMSAAAVFSAMTDADRAPTGCGAADVGTREAPAACSPDLRGRLRFVRRSRLSGLPAGMGAVSASAATNSFAAGCGLAAAAISSAFAPPGLLLWDRRLRLRCEMSAPAAVHPAAAAGVAAASGKRGPRRAMSGGELVDAVATAGLSTLATERVTWQKSRCADQGSSDSPDADRVRTRGVFGGRPATETLNPNFPASCASGSAGAGPAAAAAPVASSAAARPTGVAVAATAAGVGSAAAGGAADRSAAGAGEVGRAAAQAAAAVLRWCWLRVRPALRG